MKLKWKWVAMIEFILLLTILLVIAYFLVNNKPNNQMPSYKLFNNTNLLSLRIYTGILEPKSFLIVNYAPLKTSMESFINENNLNISIYVENLRSGAFIGINERRGYPPASLNKITTAMLLMKMAEQGELSLDTKIPINESLKSSAYGDLFKTKATELPLKVLIEKMLKESDDTSFKILKGYVHKEDRTLLLTYLDYYSRDSVDNTLPGEDNELGLVTPKSMYNVFSSLYLSTVLEPKDSEYILSLLTDTVFDIKNIADLPSNVTVAQKFAIKYAANDKYMHSCGIMYIDDRRIFYCVMTKDLSQKTAAEVIGAVVNSIYVYTIDARKELDKLTKQYDFD